MPNRGIYPYLLQWTSTSRDRAAQCVSVALRPNQGLVRHAKAWLQGLVFIAIILLTAVAVYRQPLVCVYPAFSNSAATCRSDRPFFDNDLANATISGLRSM
jgi:hypothetical protein